MAAVAVIIVKFASSSLLGIQSQLGIGLAPLDIASENRRQHHGDTETQRKKPENAHDIRNRSHRAQK